MTGLVVTLVFFAAIALLLGLAASHIKRQIAAKYRRIKPLSEVEQTLYWRLVEALPECVILSQVTFSRFMAAERVGPVTWGQYMSAQNKISQKSIDYLVCLKDFTVVAAVELDDATHVSEKDALRDSLLRGAGIEVIRVHVRDIPAAIRLREIFTNENTHAPPG